MHERCLHVDGQQHAKPDQVDTEFFRNRPQQWHHDERQFKEVQEEGQNKYQYVDDDQKTKLSTRQIAQQMFHPDMSIHTLEHQTETGGANQNEQHKA